METKIVDTKIDQETLDFIAKELNQTDRPLSLNELSKKVAFKKTSPFLAQKVKKYDPYCQYEVGDLIYKEYNEPLMVSSKGAEQFQGGVVLKVINKTEYKNFNCEMLEVDYSGGGPFRKHLDYMKKTKTQVLLPSNLEGKALKPQILEREQDPRQDELPMSESEMKKLEKNLKSALSKSSQFFHWNDYWQLKAKKVKIENDKTNEIKKYLLEKNQSATTEEIISQFFNLKPNQDEFWLYCLSLDHILEKNYKKDFILVSPFNWGKWHLKQTINGWLENLPLAAPKAKLPNFDVAPQSQPKSAHEFPLKIYLTWREILSGGLKIPLRYKREFSKSKEYTFTDVEGQKDYIVYYYPSLSICLGLKDFYEINNVPQGASLTLEKQKPTHFNFWIKKSKKKLSVAKITYNSAEDKFIDTGQEVFTFSLPNKIIHLERESLQKIFSLYDQRDKLNLEELLVLVFKIFGLEGEGFTLHYLRAYHLVDILKQTREEEVEWVLTNSPQFYKLEKKKGLFSYEEPIKTEEAEVKAPPEITPEMIPEEKVEEVPAEAIPVTSSPGQPMPPLPEEIRAPEALPEVTIKEPSPLEKPPLKKEKPVRKKRVKIRMEGEKVFRRKKGEKRIIEEKIELEESEQEALIALKAKEKKEAAEETIVASSKEKKPQYKPFVSEQPVFGIFAEKLKSALDQQKKPKKKK
ncbi:MAG: hypothetical protein ACE5GI_01140 [Candidatus Aminicenantales bacterium]